MRNLVIVLCVILGMGCATSPTLEEKIGQMLVVGFVGEEPSEMVVEAIERYKVGGVILFDQNVSNPTSDSTFGVRNITSPEQLKSLTDSLQRIAEECGAQKLFIAIDQEGGIVNRLKPVYGFPVTFSASSLGSSGSVTRTREASEDVAMTLKRGGVNINFAPCVDLAINELSPIIAGKQRAFSSRGDSVALHAAAWIEGHHAEGIITSLKHFPGHGSSQSDSHLGLVDITGTWSEEELVPYINIVEGGYDDIVMMGHLFNSNIDGEYPASLSAKTLGMVREVVGYDGVIATDDMNMGAIVEHYSLEKALELAIMGGVDMVIMGNNGAEFEEDLVERTVGIITELVRSGRISEGRIDEAYSRIMRLKGRI